MPDSTNPKDLLGVMKPDLSLVPPVAILEEARALEDGAEKYGPYNWRDKHVRARVYIAAAKRHMDSWLDGENHSRDTRYVRLTADAGWLASNGLVQGDVVRVADEIVVTDTQAGPDGTWVFVPSGVEGESSNVALSPGQYETVREPVHHLAHARACLAIIIDAESIGSLVDDRPSTPGAMGRLIKQYTKKG